MTTIKEILDKFNSAYRYGKRTESIDIGDYTFDEAHSDKTGFVFEFTSRKNPDVWLRINDDRTVIHLIKKIDENMVDLTVWFNGKKFNKKSPLKRHQIYSKNNRKPLPTKN